MPFCANQCQIIWLSAKILKFALFYVLSYYFYLKKNLLVITYILISFYSISLHKYIFSAPYACFKLRKQHQIKPQKRIIIQRSCVFPHKSCIYANQSQEIEKSFGWKRFSDVRRTNGKHIPHDLKPSSKRPPNKILSIRKTLFELILFPKNKKQTDRNCDISLTSYPHLFVWFDIKAKQKNGKNTRRLTLCLYPDTRECPRTEQNAFCPKIRDSRPMRFDILTFW